MILSVLRSGIRDHAEVRVVVGDTFVYILPLAVEESASGRAMLRYAERGLPRRELRMPVDCIGQAVRVDDLGRIPGRPTGRKRVQP